MQRGTTVSRGSSLHPQLRGTTVSWEHSGSVTSMFQPEGFSSPHRSRGKKETRRHEQTGQLGKNVKIRWSDPDDPKSAPVKRWRQEKSLSTIAAEDNRKLESVIRVSVLGQIYAVKWSLQGKRWGQTNTHIHIHTQGSSDMPCHFFLISMSLDCERAGEHTWAQEEHAMHRKGPQGAELDIGVLHKWTILLNTVEHFDLNETLFYGSTWEYLD